MSCAKEIPLTHNSENLEDTARLLEKSSDYRVLRRVPSPELRPSPLSVGQRLAIVLDCETTGLDPRVDEIVELAMISFVYDEGNSIAYANDKFNELQFPSKDLSHEVSRITGITTEMLVGKNIDPNGVARFIKDASLIIAHNAAFDRPFCEKLTQVFAKKAWADSQTEIPWATAGFDGTKLSYLVAQSGYFYNAHRALDDCAALYTLLQKPFPKYQSAFERLLLSARETRYKIWISASYDQHKALRARGYRWNPGRIGSPKAWWLEVDGLRLEDERLFISSKGLTRGHVSIRRLTAFDRYKYHF